MNKNMISRIAVALVAIPAILWICYQGGDWLHGMVLFMSLIGMGEYLWQEGFRPKQVLYWIAMSMVALLSFESMIDINHNGLFVLFFLIVGMILATGKEDSKILFSKFRSLIIGVAYIGFLYPFVYYASNTIDSSSVAFGNSGDWMLFLFSILWVGDSMALFVGKAIGKHKLAPSVSPNKTVEGFVGGLLGAILVGVGMYFWKFNWLEWHHVLLIAVGCSIFGQLGDLVESMWKRSLNIKDSSNLIPGHGGILDRFDSLLFAAPFMYYYKSFFLM